MTALPSAGITQGDKEKPGDQQETWAGDQKNCTPDVPARRGQMVCHESHRDQSYAGAERHIQEEADGRDQPVPRVGHEVQESQHSDRGADAREEDIQSDPGEHHISAACHDEDSDGCGQRSRTDRDRNPPAPKPSQPPAIAQKPAGQHAGSACDHQQRAEKRTNLTRRHTKTTDEQRWRPREHGIVNERGDSHRQEQWGQPQPAIGTRHEPAVFQRLTTAGGGCIALVHGEAGIGKTALVKELSRRQQARRVLWGACDALFTPRPLAPLNDIARQTMGVLLEAINSGTDRARSDSYSTGRP